MIIIFITKTTVITRNVLALSSRKARKPVSPTVTNSRKAEIPACGSLTK